MEDQLLKEKKYNEAIFYLEKASQSGNSYAQNELG